MKTIYEVDLRNRKTGHSVGCIYSGVNYDEAYSITDKWNQENVPDYDKDMGFDDYVDRKTEGLSACLYHIEDKTMARGIGQFVLCKISADGGKSWTTQWLTETEIAEHRKNNWIVKED